MHQAQGNEYPKESGVKNKGEKLLKISSSFMRRHFIRVLTAYRGRRTCARTWRKGGTITEEALFDGSMIGYRSDRRRSSWFLAILGLTKCIQLQTIAPYCSIQLRKPEDFQSGCMARPCTTHDGHRYRTVDRS